MTEEMLLTGSLKPTKEWYAGAKIAGIKMCQAIGVGMVSSPFRLCQPTSTDPGDNFDSESLHTLPALLRNFHDAKMQETP